MSATALDAQRVSVAVQQPAAGIPWAQFTLHVCETAKPDTCVDVTCPVVPADDATTCTVGNLWVHTEYRITATASKQDENDKTETTPASNPKDITTLWQ